MARILVLGASGCSGFSIVSRLSGAHAVRGICRNPPPSSLPIVQGESLSPETLRKHIDEFAPDVVINTVAVGDVDACEKDPALAHRVNVEGVRDLIDVLHRSGSRARLIHFSTNAVFDGLHPPYSESSPALPVNEYGRSKLEADRYVANHYANHLILRPITMFGLKQSFQRHNPVSFIIDRLSKGNSVELVDDVYGNLLYLEDLTSYVESFLSHEYRGVVHVSGDEIVNRYELGLAVARAFEFPESLVVRCSSDRFPALARRPPDTSFDNSLLKKLTGRNPTSLNAALAEMKSHMRQAGG